MDTQSFHGKTKTAGLPISQCCGIEMWRHKHFTHPSDHQRSWAVVQLSRTTNFLPPLQNANAKGHNFKIFNSFFSVPQLLCEILHVMFFFSGCSGYIFVQNYIFRIYTQNYMYTIWTDYIIYLLHIQYSSACNCIFKDWLVNRLSNNSTCQIFKCLNKRSAK